VRRALRQWLDGLPGSKIPIDLHGSELEPNHPALRIFERQSNPRHHLVFRKRTTPFFSLAYSMAFPLQLIVVRQAWMTGLVLRLSPGFPFGVEWQMV
jgi:hypothetical protein